ncbi:MAG TPA: lipid II flippase Amj family protein [Steroidobacteraceae bacterium]
MDTQLLVICILTFVIHLIGTLAYAARIAGVRTRRIAISFSLFNILILVSRTSNSFQGPFLAKRIENNIAGGVSHGLLADFRWMMWSATLATILGALLIPTFQRSFSRAVLHFQAHRSVPRLLLHIFFKGGLAQLKNVASLPTAANLTQIRSGRTISSPVIALNVAAVALWTTGVFASLYAGYLNPELRVTSSTLSAVVNGAATIMMFVFIDPQLSVMTDDVVEGRTTESHFRRAVVWLVGGRLVGTLLAQLILVPAAMLIVRVARII